MDAKTKPLSPKQASFASAALASPSRLSASLEEECQDELIRFTWAISQLQENVVTYIAMPLNDALIS
jgi:hypothetical protein